MQDKLEIFPEQWTGNARACVRSSNARDRRRVEMSQLCNDGQEERRDADEDQQKTDGYPQYSEFRFHVPSGK